MIGYIQYDNQLQYSKIGYSMISNYNNLLTFYYFHYICQEGAAGFAGENPGTSFLLGEAYGRYVL
jgi:hypothetical protein